MNAIRAAVAAVIVLLAVPAATAQDQQLGARTKAMGGSYTAFEDDPVSVWLNPAGIATQPDSASIAYQTYTTYPLHREKLEGSDVITFSAEAETTFVDPAFIPSYLGFVFHVGEPDSGMAIGVCYARPYVLNYSFDEIEDPFLTTFEPDSNMEQSFNRFRAAFAKDFRLRDFGEPGFLTHVSVGAGLDVGYERWEYRSTTASASDNATGFGFGVGGLLGVYDNTSSLRVNLGVAYQSAVQWNFNIDPDIFPAFDMPQQVNAGVTLYLLEGFPLRTTFDFQWIEWSATADDPFFPGHPEFEDAFNFSFGAEYKVPVGAGINLYPRVGYRRFDAPWEDKDDLPMTGPFKLLLDTKGEAFNLVTVGIGVSWASEEGQVRSVDIGADFGGDAPNLAFGLNYEF
jgi:long-subunit fatty acid transport protein